MLKDKKGAVRMKDSKRSLTLVLIAVLLLFSFVGCSSDEAAVFDEEIKFPEGTDSQLDENATLTYNAKELEAQLPSGAAYYVSYDPVPTDYAIAAKLGFDAEDFKTYDDGERVYEAEGKDKTKSLYIEPDGRFSYYSGVKGTTFQIALSEKDCYEIAKSFLMDNDLFLEEFGNKASVNEAEALGSASEGHRVTALGVSFLAEGKYCDSRATVTINGNGEVISVIYNAKKFAQHKKVKLIPIESAIERIKQNKALIDVGELYSYTDLKFETVSVKNREYAKEDNTVLVQPVYVFEGTVTAADGTTHTCSVTVQANQFQ